MPAVGRFAVREISVGNHGNLARLCEASDKALNMTSSVMIGDTQTKRPGRRLPFKPGSGTCRQAARLIGAAPFWERGGSGFNDAAARGRCDIRTVRADRDQMSLSDRVKLLAGQKSRAIRVNPYGRKLPY
jgi:hypothetical protein